MKSDVHATNLLAQARYEQTGSG